MSELLTNLNTIYNVKLQLKEALETTSDNFVDYPTYVTAMKPTGYTNIVENGDVDVSSYKYAYVNVPTGGGSSRDIDDKPTSDYGTYGLHPAINLNDQYYDSASSSYQHLISSKCFTQDYPSYIDGEYVPTSITGKSDKNAYYISYEAETTSRNLSYNSLRDISERVMGEAGFFKAKVNFKTTTDTIPSINAMFTTTKNQVLNSNTNATYYDIESLGSVQRYDAKWIDDLNKTFLRINSYYSNGLLTSYYPMTYMSKNLQEKNNTYYDMGNLLHNSYNAILWVDTTEASGMKNSMVVDIVGWNGEAQLPASISSMNFNFVTGGAAPIAWTDSGSAYTYTMTMSARQTMQISTSRTNASYFTCTLGNDATSYYVKVPNMQIFDNVQSTYWTDFTTTGSTVNGQLSNTVNDSMNVELSIDKATGKLTVGKVEPKNGWYINAETLNPNTNEREYQEYEMTLSSAFGSSAHIYEYPTSWDTTMGQCYFTKYIDGVGHDYYADAQTMEVSEFDLNDYNRENSILLATGDGNTTMTIGSRVYNIYVDDDSSTCWGDAE